LPALVLVRPAPRRRLMRRVLVSGSAGFIGGYLVAELLSRGYAVTGVDDYSKYGKVRRSYDDHPRYRLVIGDAGDAGLMTDLLADCDHFVAGAAATGQQPARRMWFELALLAAAAGAAAAAKGTLILIAAHGGFRVWPIGSGLASFGMLPGHLLLAAHGLLVLFGGDFFSHRLGLVSGLAMLHWVGLGLAAWALCTAIRRLPGRDDLVSQLLAAGILANLAAYVCGLRAVDLHSTREIAAVLPLSAALAGRLLAPRLAAARMAPALLVVGTGYLLCLGREIAAPPQPGTGQELARWLEDHKLTSGLAPYWQA